MSDYVTKSWPVLYKTGSNGKELMWQIRVEPHPHEPNTHWFDIVTIHGQVDGKQQEQRVQVKQGKNMGRANQTSCQQQAINEAEAKWTKQHDKTYSETRGGSAKTYKPMLAHTYGDHKEKVVFPSHVQPKLDGHRCISIRHERNVELLTRNGKPYLGLDHIRGELMMAMKVGEVWDGEIYCHGMTFQRMTSLIKKPQVDSVELQYHVYDLVDDLHFVNRNMVLNDALKKPYKFLKHVLTACVQSHDEVMTLYKRFIEAEYEGAMLRSGCCTYREGARSNQLLKIKEWMDSEFQVVDVIEDKKNQGVFVCQTEDGDTFNVKCKGDDASRAEYLANKQNYIGKWLTVKFFEWTTSSPKLPRFPIGIGIREDHL